MKKIWRYLMSIEAVVQAHLEATENIIQLSTEAAKYEDSKKGQTKAAIVILKTSTDALIATSPTYIDNALLNKVRQYVDYIDGCFKTKWYEWTIKIFEVLGRLTKLTIYLQETADCINSISETDKIKEIQSFLKSLYFFLLTLNEDLPQKINDNWFIKRMKNTDTVKELSTNIENLLKTISIKYKQLQLKEPKAGEGEKKELLDIAPKKPTSSHATVAKILPKDGVPLFLGDQPISTAELVQIHQEGAKSAPPSTEHFTIEKPSTTDEDSTHSTSPRTN